MHMGQKGEEKVKEGKERTKRGKGCRQGQVRQNK